MYTLQVTTLMYLFIFFTINCYNKVLLHLNGAVITTVTSCIDLFFKLREE